MQQACLKFNGIYKNKAKHDSVACMNNKKICIAQLLVAMNNICEQKRRYNGKALFKLCLQHLFQMYYIPPNKRYFMIRNCLEI